MFRLLERVICVTIAFHLVRCSELSGEFSSIFSHVKSYAKLDTQAEAAFDVIKRTIPQHAHLFHITINDELPQHTFRLFKVNESDIVEIEATSGVIACKGFGHYLKYYCNSHISWDGNRIKLPDRLPDVNVTETSPSRFIYYQNVCTWSYSFAWYDWKQWQRHIDWMALQGITLSLAPNQELVWDRVYTELGLTRTEIDDHFAGPAFFAWQRMGNIRGWGGTLPNQFKRWSSILQKQIIAALRNLGITVALPAFAGHVPVAFQRIFPNATLTPVDRWNRFPDAFCCPLFIDPTDPLFKRVGELFLTKIIEEYGGTNHIYFSDPFNEINPRLSSADYLASAANGIYETMKSVDDKAVWLLQAWMFVKNPFWSDDLLRSFLTAVPLGRLLVLDLQSELFPQYSRTKSFYGQPFIWCMLHNFGGTLGMHGSLDIVNEDIVRARKVENSSMIGVGITPEGINQNYVMYEFALERGWSHNPTNVSKWIKHYAERRYGFENENVSKAWHMLQNTVYNYKGLIKINGKYTVCRRPSINLSPFTWYNLTLLDDIVDNFMRVPLEEIIDNEFYKHDLVDITRQMLQNKIDLLYAKIVSAFHAKNQPNFIRMRKDFEAILSDLDAILQSNEHFLLGQWLESAKQLATNQVEQQMYEFNARNQITIWGPTGQIVDYATKQWAGLVADYCLPRWQVFFDELQSSWSSKSRKFNDNKCKRKIFKQIEEPFGVDHKQYSNSAQGDAIQLAKGILQRWRGTHWMDG